MRQCLKLVDGATVANGKPSNTAATGSIVAAAGSTITNLTHFVLDDGINPAVEFVFDTGSTTVESATKKKIAYTTGDTAGTIKTAITNAINGFTASLRITATDGGGNTITLTNDFGGDHGNTTFTNTTGLTSTGMTGGVQVGFTLNGMVNGTKYAWRGIDNGVVLVQSTAGSGTMDVTVRMWGYSFLTRKWAALGSHLTDVTKRGVLNYGNAITEDGADNLFHAEPISDLSAFEYAYAEIVSINGTSTAVDVWLNSTMRQVAH